MNDHFGEKVFNPERERKKQKGYRIKLKKISPKNEEKQIRNTSEEKNGKPI